MACGNSNLCKKVGYCNMGGYCKKVHPKIREQLLQTGEKPEKVDVEIFIANGSGENCKLS